MYSLLNNFLYVNLFKIFILKTKFCNCQVYRRCEAAYTQTYFSTSSVRKQSRFGEIGKPEGWQACGKCSL